MEAQKAKLNFQRAAILAKNSERGILRSFVHPVHLDAVVALRTLRDFFKNIKVLI